MGSIAAWRGLCAAGGVIQNLERRSETSEYVNPSGRKCVDKGQDRLAGAGNHNIWTAEEQGGLAIERASPMLPTQVGK